MHVATHPDDIAGAQAAVGDVAEIVEMENGDSWIRDSGPTFVKNRGTGEVCESVVKFNGSLVCSCL